MIAASIRPSGSARSARLAVLAVIALVAGLLGFSAPAPAAAAITTGISGVVKDQAANNLPNVGVTPFMHVGDFWHQLSTVYTDSNGAYELAVGAGEYRVQYLVNNFTHASEYWNNSPSFAGATSINVTTNSVFTANVSVEVGGTISGHVGGSTAGNHLVNAPVSVWRLTPLGFWQSMGSTFTNASGNYSFGGLATGNYRVQFQPGTGQNFVPEFYVDSQGVDAAQNVAVTVGQNAPNINAILTAGGTISGQVLGDTGSGTVPLAGINVQAIKAVNDGSFYAPVVTNASGNYTFTGLPAGDYVVAFNPQDGAYLYEYWNDHRVFEEADLVNVTVGGTDVANATLTRAAQINGVVTGPGGPVANVTVYAWDASGNFTSTASGDQTDSLGQYSLTGLPAGSYKLEFRPESGSPLVREWWNDQFSSAAATPVAVTTGQVVNGINPTLATGATVSGTVTGQGSGNLAGVTVEARRYSADSQRWEVFRSTTTAANGTYTLSGLEVADYAIRFSDFANGWAQQYWQNDAGVTEANLLSLTLGQNQTGINATLVQGATFSGTVLGATSGSPVPVAAFVSAERQGAGGVWETVTSVTANASGVYSVKGLAAGTYRFTYSASTYAWTFWGDAYFADEADLVALTGAQVDSGNNLTLAQGVQLHGQATAAGGVPLERYQLTVLYERSEGVWDTPDLFGGSGDDVVYNLGGLPPGTYKVKFADVSGDPDPYLTQWWNNKPTEETATEIVAAPGANIQGISAVLTKDPWQFTAAPVPTITGVAQAGGILTAVPGTWAPGPVDLAYQWFVGGVARSGETGATFTPDASDAGAVVTVAVTGTKTDFAPTTKTSAGTAPLLTVFSDVPVGAPFFTEITWMFESAVSRGYIDESGVRTYHTTEDVSRQAMAAFLYRLAGSPAFTPPATPTFSDVGTNHAFFKEIEWMKAQGITNGNVDGTYGAGDPVSRQAMAAFLYRYSGSPAFTPPATPTFSDVPTTHPFFKEIEWMKANGITNGNVDGTYGGVDPVSRQAMAAFLYRIIH